MSGFLELTVDKFTFKVAIDRLYSREGLWAKVEGNQLRIGMTDFLQQRSGDVAFAEVKPLGTLLAAGDEVAVVETIKVNISLASPAAGRVVEINPAISAAPEVINQDPYGDGWMALIELANWKADRAWLLDPQAYFALMKDEAETEIKTP
jgi:glycine cleavage system H protein